MSYYDDYINKTKKEREAEIALINDTAKKQTDIINENYGAQIKEAQTAYDDQYRANAVQKLVNERQVAESMANSGLTNSGLNRTQQTAIQLSYANSRAEIDRKRQSAIDTLNREMTAKLTDIDTTAASSVASVNSAYSNAAMSYQENMLTEDKKNAATVEAARIKAEEEAKSKKSLLDYGTLASTSYGENGNVIYTDKSGNAVTMRAGSNPFTGDINSDLLNEFGEYDPSRAFNNGYQPRYYKGNELTAYKPAKTSGITSKTTVYWRKDGVEQQVFTTGSKYYLWYGPENRYVEAIYDPFAEEWKVNLKQ